MSSVGKNALDARFRNLAQVTREWADGDTPQGQAPQWLALERSLQRQGGAARRRRAVGISALAVAAVATLFVIRGPDRWGGQGDAPLTFVVAKAASVAGGMVQPARNLAQVSFSDGSGVVFNAGASGAVMNTTARGARVRLEQGRARFTVVPRPQAEWTVEAGPFTVVVHGTVFDVLWGKESGALAVDLIAGSVTVKGPVAGGQVRLRAGQRLVARANRGESQVDVVGSTTPSLDDVFPPGGVSPAAVNDVDQREVPAASRAGELPGVGAAGVTADGGKLLPARRHSRGGDERTREGARGDRSQRGRVAPPGAGLPPVAEISRSWAARVAAGSFQGVIEDADTTGIERCLAQAPAGALAALADAARYARRTDLARRALLAERRRFPGTAGSHDAAFLIGRLAEDSGGDLREALRWYDRYLEEAEAGTYSSEALGRKMLALDRLGAAADAHAIAERYLAAFPQGAFAARARRIEQRN